MKFLERITNFGVTKKTPPLLKRKIKLTNQISIAISFVFALIVLLMIANKHFNSAILMFIVSVIYFFIPLMNKKKYLISSSLIVSILIPIFIVFASVIAKVKAESSRDIAFYITPRLMIFASLVIPLVLIDYTKKFYFYFTLFIYFVAFVLFDFIHELAGVGITHANFGKYSDINIALASLFSLVVLVLSFVFMQRSNHNYEKELEISNSSLKEKNDELIAAEEELRQSNEELSVIKNILEEKEERLRHILENQGHGFGIINLEGFFTFVNSAAEEIFGVEKDTLIGKNISDFFVGDELNNLLKTSKEGKNIFKHDIEIELNIHNKKKNILVSISSDRDRNKRIIGLNGVFKDITELKNEQEKIKQLNTELNKYFVALENTPATIVITDLKGNIEYVNPYFTKMTGYSYEEAIGKNPRILKTKYTPEERFTELWQTISTGKVWEGELINHKKNKEIFIERAVIAPVKNDKDEIINYIAIKEDITEFKKAQEELAKKINQQEILINNLPANIFLKDSELRYLSVNKKYAKSLNLSPEQMRGKKYSDFFPEEKFVEETDLKIIKTKQALINLEKQEKDKWLSISKVPYFDDKNNIGGIIGIIQDITGRKLKEQKIIELNQELKKYFVAIEQSSIGIAFLDKNGIRQYVNNKYLQITGYSLEQAIGQKSGFFDTKNSEDLQKLKNGEIIKKEYFRKAVNEYFQRIVVSPILNEKKEIELFVFLIEDISKEKQQQRIIKDQYKKLQSALNSINESLNYAKIIQESLLPDEKTIKKYFTENFVLFLAKDVVSGDFYFFKKYNDYLIFAVADCTGHGIPGAFISMLGYSLLNQIIRYHRVETPGEALEMLREQTKNIFINFNGGMDIALCAINIKTKELQYAGAYNPLYIIRNKELIEIKATQNPIGYYPVEKKFETRTIELEDNDAIYLFSDGYADQFGEDEKGKKSKYTKKRFKNILVNISLREMEEQKQLLQNNFDLWRDGQEQIDDVTIIGLRWNSKNIK